MQVHSSTTEYCGRVHVALGAAHDGRPACLLASQLSMAALGARASKHSELLDSASSDDDGDGSPAFHVNEEYARRFEVRRHARNRVRCAAVLTLWPCARF